LIDQSKENGMDDRKEARREERRRQILEGALQVFSVKGFRAATNKEVAEAAGIKSPGLIYHYFKSKEDLLRAVIERFAPPAQLLSQREALFRLPVEEFLSHFGTAYLRLADDPKIGSCLKLLIGEAQRSPEFAGVMREAGPLRLWRFLADYLESRMEAGELRRMDPAAAAWCFMGPFAARWIAVQALGMSDFPGADPESLARAQVEIFLNGLKAR
jgi:AcrR family transcriptional regulator